ncbi:hypothetical protein V2A60_008013 [Cordyceps javanica]
MLLQTVEGKAPFIVPGLAKPCETWYRVVGDLANPACTPLVVLHGGPGACHDYLLPLTDLSSSSSSSSAAVPLIFYDQLGNGRSTHLPEKNGDEAFWTVDLFRAELDNLLRHLGLLATDDGGGGRGRPLDVYGHSWGGMLAAEWAAATGTSTASTRNLRRLVIASSLASMDAWRVGITALRSRMPPAERAVLDRADETGDYASAEYEAAMDVFYQRHLSLARPWPAPEVRAALDWFAKDPTTYGTMYGPSELAITGSLRNWNIVPQLHKIAVPTLLINGAEDEAQDVAMQPFFDYMPHVKWVTLDKAAHFSHVDQREKHMQHVGAFLAAT